MMTVNKSASQHSLCVMDRAPLPRALGRGMPCGPAVQPLGRSSCLWHSVDGSGTRAFISYLAMALLHLS